jgi:hypothetical protein
VERCFEHSIVRNRFRSTVVGRFGIYRFVRRSNQPMKPTAPRRSNFSEVVAAPTIALLVTTALFVPSITPAQTTGLPTYTATEAAKHIGQLATVADKISGVYKDQYGDLLLVMGGKYPNQTFIVAIPAKSAWNFSDYHKYYGQMVAVFGKITLYMGKPEITVWTRTQFVQR